MRPKSIVELGHNLGLHVVAEGVETGGVQDAVAATGCDLVQGYFFARPPPSGPTPRPTGRGRPVAGLTPTG